MKRLLPLLLLVGGCDGLPRDTDGTLDRVRASRVVHVGVVGGGRPDPKAVAALIERVAQASGSRPALVAGSAEALIAALDADQVDLVVGPFAEKSPWQSEVSLAPPLARTTVGGTPLLLRAAVRNGENRWAMLVEHASRQVAPDGDKL